MSWRQILCEGLNIYEPMRGAIVVATLLAVVVLVWDVGHRATVRGRPPAPIPDTPLSLRRVLRAVPRRRHVLLG